MRPSAWPLTSWAENWHTGYPWPGKYLHQIGYCAVFFCLSQERARDRQTDRQTDRQDPQCGLLGRPRYTWLNPPACIGDPECIRSFAVILSILMKSAACEYDRMVEIFPTKIGKTFKCIFACSFASRLVSSTYGRQGRRPRQKCRGGQQDESNFGRQRCFSPSFYSFSSPTFCPTFKTRSLSLRARVSRVL